MATLNPYLTFNGTCEEAFAFYKSVFGGDFRTLSRYKDMPPTPGRPVPDTARERILHVALPLSAETVLMGCDSNPAVGEARFGKNVALSVSVESREQADTIFRGLSAGGTITMPIADTFWGAYFGMLTDKFGIGWMVSFEPPR